MKLNLRCANCPKCGAEVVEEIDGGGFILGKGPESGKILFKCWNKECISKGYSCYTFFEMPKYNKKIIINLEKNDKLV